MAKTSRHSSLINRHAIFKSLRKSTSWKNPLHFTHVFLAENAKRLGLRFHSISVLVLLLLRCFGMLDQFLLSGQDDSSKADAAVRCTMGVVVFCLTKFELHILNEKVLMNSTEPGHYNIIKL